MNKPNVPNAAFMAAAEVSAVDDDTIDSILEAGAPEIVAAAFEAAAEEFEGNARACKNLGSTEHAYGRAEGLTLAKEALRRRAAELRGEQP